MFFINLKVTKNRALTGVTLFLVVILLVISIFSYSNSKQINGEDLASRKAYLSSLGFSCEEASEEKTLITIPTDFSKTYSDYNKRQLEAGFNLLDYKGYDATVYTYLISNLENLDGVYANLIVIDGKIIGGDISSIENGGFVLPLKTKRENEEILKSYVATT